MAATEQAIWDAYNLLLMGPDVERLRKLLARAELFRMSIDVPGDVVECGVFKGAGLMLWLKLLQIHTPGSNKRVVGFDAFGGFPDGGSPQESDAVARFTAEASYSGTSVDMILKAVDAAGLDRSKCDLIDGDIRQTAQEYVNSRPGFRISLLHLDLDLQAPTLAALEALWPRVTPGGVVVFDEYAVAGWSESQAVDEYFQRENVKLRTICWARTPTAYIVKGS